MSCMTDIYGHEWTSLYESGHSNGDTLQQHGGTISGDNSRWRKGRDDFDGMSVPEHDVTAREVMREAARPTRVNTIARDLKGPPKCELSFPTV